MDRYEAKESYVIKRNNKTMRKETYKKFYKCTIENSHTNFTIDEIYENTKKIYDKYSTQDLVRLSD